MVTPAEIRTVSVMHSCEKVEHNVLCKTQSKLLNYNKQ